MEILPRPIVGLLVVATGIEGKRGTRYAESSESNPCDKYCFKNCTADFTSGSVDYSECTSANVKCFCMLNAALDMALIFTAFIVVSIVLCCVWCQKRMKRDSSRSRSTARRRPSNLAFLEQDGFSTMQNTPANENIRGSQILGRSSPGARSYTLQPQMAGSVSTRYLGPQP